MDIDRDEKERQTEREKGGVKGRGRRKEETQRAS